MGLTAVQLNASQHDIHFSKLQSFIFCPSIDGEQYISISLPLLIPAEKLVLCGGNKQPDCISHYVQYSEWTDGTIVIDRNGDFMGMTSAELNA